MTARARAAAAPAAKLRIRQVRSGIGFDRTQKATLRALGLGRLGRVREHPDNPQVRGMIAKIPHLVAVEEAGARSER
jgi:large subunit ribosomal protein L30